MVHSTSLRVTRWSGAATLALVVACGGDEAQPTEDHTPESYTISMDGTPVTAPYTFPLGQTVLVRIQFVNQLGENLDDVESSHFAGLTFAPGALATAERRADHHFQFDVRGNATGSGTVTVGFGHDDAAVEKTFSPEPVNIVQTTGGQ